MAEHEETITRESSQTSERREIENLRQIYGDKWYKEQLQVPINYSQPIKQEQKNHYHKELIMELRGSGWDMRVYTGLKGVKEASIMGVPGGPADVRTRGSGRPIYDNSGNIVGVVISQLDKLKMVEVIGALPENVNFGIKASTVRQFLTSSGLPSKKSERTEEKSTEQLAEIAKNQALMVMCLQ